MSGIFDVKHRQVIPRWLDYPTSCALGLLRKNAVSFQLPDSLTRNNQAPVDWHEKPSLSTAVDVVAEALILHDHENADAKNAATFILSNAPESSRLLREIAYQFMNQPLSRTTFLPDKPDLKQMHGCVALLKRSVRHHPLNPIAWSDLSLCYAMLGTVEKSRRAMQVALDLGKYNRFVLRSAARCFVHVGEPDRAIRLLKDSKLIGIDPWITSAEIAIADNMERHGLHINEAKALVQNDNISPFEKSELAACLGTIESKGGYRKKAKKFMSQALQDPSENALAQIEWLARQLNTEIAMPPNLVPASFEAQARHLQREKKFIESMSAAEQWARFQPFSSRPLILATFLSSVSLENDAHTIEIVFNAAPAHRNSPLLMNNLAFALARQGKLEQASAALATIDIKNAQQRELLTLAATQGLIYFRMGLSDKGRELYRKAVLGFDSLQESQAATIASFYWAVEEKRIKSNDANERIVDAKKRLEKAPVPELENVAKTQLA